MQAPLQSTLTLVAELFIAGIIFSVIYRAWAKEIFMKRLAVFAIIYESIFNIGYMLFRSISKSNVIFSPSMKIVGALHGILSLVILIAVIVIFIKAIKANSRGENYFKSHKMGTLSFIIGWAISLLSGIWLYLAAYYF